MTAFLQEHERKLDFSACHRTLIHLVVVLINVGSTKAKNFLLEKAKILLQQGLPTIKESLDPIIHTLNLNIIRYQVFSLLFQRNISRKKLTSLC